MPAQVATQAMNVTVCRSGLNCPQSPQQLIFVMANPSESEDAISEMEGSGKVVILNLLVQGCKSYAQELGGLGLVSPRVGERFLDVSLFYALQIP